MYNRLTFETKLMILNIECKISSAEGEMWQVTFFLCSCMNLSFNIVGCLLSFPTCILHTLSKSSTVSFSLIPSQNTPFRVIIHDSLLFTWVALRISFLLEWLDTYLHFWFRHLNLLKILNSLPYLTAKTSLHSARPLGESWWKYRKYKRKSKAKSRSRSYKKTYFKSSFFLIKRFVAHIISNMSNLFFKGIFDFGRGDKLC